jgi:hypothetical protein
MGKPDDGKNARKPYEKPTVTKLSPEQAKLKRLGMPAIATKKRRAFWR